jgi:hypothetical protein
MGATSQGVDGPRDGTGDTGRDSLEELLVRVRSMGMGAAATPAIGTKGVFPLMELPSELRLQVRRAPAQRRRTHAARADYF